MNHLTIQQKVNKYVKETQNASTSATAANPENAEGTQNTTPVVEKTQSQLDLDYKADQVHLTKEQLQAIRNVQTFFKDYRTESQVWKVMKPFDFVESIGRDIIQSQLARQKEAEQLKDGWITVEKKKPAPLSKKDLDKKRAQSAKPRDRRDYAYNQGGQGDDEGKNQRRWDRARKNQQRDNTGGDGGDAAGGNNAADGPSQNRPRKNYVRDGASRGNRDFGNTFEQRRQQARSQGRHARERSRSNSNEQNEGRQQQRSRRPRNLPQQQQQDYQEQQGYQQQQQQGNFVQGRYPQNQSYRDTRDRNRPRYGQDQYQQGGSHRNDEVPQRTNRRRNRPEFEYVKVEPKDAPAPPAPQDKADAQQKTPSTNAVAQTRRADAPQATPAPDNATKESALKQQRDEKPSQKFTESGSQQRTQAQTATANVTSVAAPPKQSQQSQQPQQQPQSQPQAQQSQQREEKAPQPTPSQGNETVQPRAQPPATTTTTTTTTTTPAATSTTTGGEKQRPRGTVARPERNYQSRGGDQDQRPYQRSSNQQQQQQQQQYGDSQRQQHREDRGPVIQRQNPDSRLGQQNRTHTEHVVQVKRADPQTRSEAPPPVIVRAKDTQTKERQPSQSSGKSDSPLQSSEPYTQAASEQASYARQNENDGPGSIGSQKKKSSPQKTVPTSAVSAPAQQQQQQQVTPQPQPQQVTPQPQQVTLQPQVVPQQQQQLPFLQQVPQDPSQIFQQQQFVCVYMPAPNGQMIPAYMPANFVQQFYMQQQQQQQQQQPNIAFPQFAGAGLPQQAPAGAYVPQGGADAQRH